MSALCAGQSRPAGQAGQLSVTQSTADEAAEVMGFLARRPIHTFALSGFIKDNGAASPLNRGTFYTCRTPAGRIEGVALIGHHTLFEACSKAAVACFARVARETPDMHLVLAEQETMSEFWKHYGDGGQRARHICRQVLMEMTTPPVVLDPVPGLRLATMGDLEAIIPLHAQLSTEESGVNPLEVDWEGFCRRCARRIERDRTWIWVEDGRLLFKAEIISETPDVIYIEGVWIHPRERGKGYVMRLVSELAAKFLARSRALSLFVNEENRAARACFRRVGFKRVGCYDTIFLD